MNYEEWSAGAYRKCQVDPIIAEPMENTETPVDVAAQAVDPNDPKPPGAHGGKRSKAGRPPLPPGEKLKIMSITLKEEQIALLKQWAKEDKVSVSGVIRAWIDESELDAAG